MVISQGGDKLARLADLLQVPVGTTINGKGSISEYHPMSLGGIGGNGGRPYANDYLREADAILFIGTKVNYLVTLGDTVPNRSKPVTVSTSMPIP